MLPTLSSDKIYQFFVFFTPAMIGIILHEIAHGWAAYKQGDPTAKALGRLTLNPLKHLDTTGTLVFVVTALFSNFIFGWAKPVPIQPRYFANPRNGMMIVSLAGPLTNFLLAFAFGLLAKILFILFPPLYSTSPITNFFLEAAVAGVLINCMLGLFNLMPIPPLDGSHILGGLLPTDLAVQYYKVGRYGFIILLLCVYFGFFGKILGPVVYGMAHFIYSLFGLLTV